MDQLFVKWAFGILVILILITLFILFVKLNIRNEYFRSATTGTKCRFKNTQGKKVRGYIISRHDDRVKIHSQGKEYKREIRNTLPL
jgi:hypothetical protein